MGGSSSTRTVVLLRAVNVGGRGRLPMAQLRQVCVDAGCDEVETYIQSGNVVLSSPYPEADLRRVLGEALAGIGVATEVMVRSAAEMADVAAASPFPDAEPGHLHVAFLHGAPETDQVAAVAAVDLAPERAVVVGREVHLHLPTGIGRSKLPAAVGKALGGAAMTVRNWRTVTTLRDMAR